MMGYKKISGLLCVTLLCLAQVVSAQNIDDLRHDKEQIELQLRETNRALQKNLKSAKSMISELELLNAEIKDRNKYINALSAEVSRLNRQQKQMQDSIVLLQRELKEKQDSYAKAVRSMGNRQNKYDKLLFIFSANSFEQSYRRARYLKEYSQWRKQQAQDIKLKRIELDVKQQHLDLLIVERQSIIAERTKEANSLKSKQKDKKDFVAQLRKKEKSLRKEANRQRADIDRLNNQIDNIIAEEARKAAERARAEAEAEAARLAAEQGDASTSTPAEKKDETAQSSSNPASKSQYNMPRADRELSGSFEKNKGKLPFPTSAQYRIVGHFGFQKHPEFKYLDKNNIGIDIETTPGAKARAVYGGEVARVFSFGGAEKAVMLRHGNYYTVYTGLIEVYVKAGDKVEVRQELGLIYSDPKDNNRTRFSFQIRKEMEKLNPEHWLDM